MEEEEGEFIVSPCPARGGGGEGATLLQGGRCNQFPFAQRTSSHLIRTNGHFQFFFFQNESPCLVAPRKESAGEGGGGKT